MYPVQQAVFLQLQAMQRQLLTILENICSKFSVFVEGIAQGTDAETILRSFNCGRLYCGIRSTAGFGSRKVP